jgi:uncharacterized protein
MSKIKCRTNFEGRNTKGHSPCFIRPSFDIRYSTFDIPAPPLDRPDAAAYIHGMNDSIPPAAQPAPRWRPLNSIDRRVLGVLGEKAKTTPDAYPMTLNALVAGCNQKSNRAPVLQLEADQVEESLDRLREFGAVALVEGSGRVQKYRHYLYEWLGVSKVELSVMIELLLRGDQTVGELRGRVSRMDPVDDLNALRELLNSLKSKGLVIPLTPEGRGQVYTHALYPQRDLDNQRARYASQGAAAAELDEADESPPPAMVRPLPPAAPRTVASPHPVTVEPRGGDAEMLRQTLEDLRGHVRQQQDEINELSATIKRMEDELHDLRRALGG